jgi:hypothetical protein
MRAASACEIQSAGPSFFVLFVVELFNYLVLPSDHKMKESN